MIEEEVIALKRSYGSNGRVTTRQYNLSSYFLLPIVLSAGFRYKGFKNSYIFNTGQELDNLQYLHIKVEAEDNNLKRNKRYVSHNKISDGYLYTFDISDFSTDVDLFIQGKYSKLSEDLKDILCRTQPVRPEMNSEIYKILYRTQDKRERIEELVGQRLDDDAELASSPYIDEEIFYEQ